MQPKTPNPPKKVKLLLSSSNPQPLDYIQNLRLILQSILLAYESGCTLRPAIESETSGYGCEDHFFEKEVGENCWELLALILEFNKEIGNRKTLVEVGTPISVNGNLYNCSLLIWYDRIVVVRPKENLAEGGLFNEARHFVCNRWGNVAEALNQRQDPQDCTGDFLSKSRIRNVYKGYSIRDVV